MSLLFFSWFEVTDLQCQFRGGFLVGLGEEMTPGSVVGCIENIESTMVFYRFHFFRYLVNWMISN